MDLSIFKIGFFPFGSSFFSEYVFGILINSSLVIIYFGFITLFVFPFNFLISFCDSSSFIGSSSFFIFSSFAIFI